jgi:hypothetical protein
VSPELDRREQPATGVVLDGGALRLPQIRHLGGHIFTLARRMGTSVKMIDRTYGHLVAGADVYECELLDAFDGSQSDAVGRAVDAEGGQDAA